MVLDARERLHPAVLGVFESDYPQAITMLDYVLVVEDSLRSRQITESKAIDKIISPITQLTDFLLYRSYRSFNNRISKEKGWDLAEGTTHRTNDQLASGNPFYLGINGAGFVFATYHIDVGIAVAQQNIITKDDIRKHVVGYLANYNQYVSQGIETIIDLFWGNYQIPAKEFPTEDTIPTAIYNGIEEVHTEFNKMFKKTSYPESATTYVLAPGVPFFNPNDLKQVSALVSEAIKRNHLTKPGNTDIEDVEHIVEIKIADVGPDSIVYGGPQHQEFNEPVFITTTS